MTTTAFFMPTVNIMVGMAFNNTSVGYVHAIAHQLGGLYDLPHGILNAILLPHVERFNAKTCPERIRDIAVAMGIDVSGISVEEGAEAAIKAIMHARLPIQLKQHTKSYLRYYFLHSNTPYIRAYFLHSSCFK